MDNIKNFSVTTKVIKLLAANLLQRNKKFKGVHEGESCYIFGNGASLSYYDLSKFNDKVSFGCNMLILHKDFNKLDVRYYSSLHPFFYYPFWKHPYSGKHLKNIYGMFHKKKILASKKVSFFINLSNYFGLKGDNIYYTYHFNKPFSGYDDCELDGSFTAMDSSLSCMLGMAVYMGFKDIVLVGCDYTCVPKVIGHFYEKKSNEESFSEIPFNETFVRAAAEKVKLQTLVPSDKYKGHILPTISYESLTGSKPIYRENNTILSNEDLLVLDSLGMPYDIF